MRRFRDIGSEDWWSFFSLGRWLVWAGIIPVSYYLGWIYSIAFVAICSLYANVASDLAAWRADRNPKLWQKLEEIDAKLDRLLPRD